MLEQNFILHLRNSCILQSGCFAGVGSRLKGFHAERCTQVLNDGILHGCRIHGIAVHHGSDSDRPCLAVWGTRQLALLQLSWQQAQSRFSILKLAHVTQLPHWVLQAEITASHDGPVSEDTDEAVEVAGGFQRESCDVVLGLMDNSVELWTFTPAQAPSSTTRCASFRNDVQRRLWQGTRVARVECESRLLLYSLRLEVTLPTNAASINRQAIKVVVASGDALSPGDASLPSVVSERSLRHGRAPVDTPSSSSTCTCACKFPEVTQTISACTAANM